MRTILVAALLASLGACAPAYTIDHDPVVVRVPPPPVRVEVPGPAPWPDAVWAPGYWYWIGHDYAWVDGRWERPPAVGFVWVRAGWVFHDHHYRFVPGRWAHPHRVPPHRYYRPAPHRPPPRRHAR